MMRLWVELDVTSLCIPLVEFTFMVLSLYYIEIGGQACIERQYRRLFLFDSFGRFLSGNWSYVI